MSGVNSGRQTRSATTAGSQQQGGPPGKGGRRYHRKSRTGCQQCKAAHLKCDETLPKCGLCTKKNQACSLGDLTAAPLGGASGVPQQPLPTFPQQPVPAIRQLPAGTAVPTGAVNNAQQRLEPPFPRVQGEPPRQSPVRVTAGQQRAQRQEQPAVRSANPSPRPPPSLGSRNSNPPGPAGHPSRPSSAAGTPGHIFMPQDTPNPNPPTPHIGAEQADLFQPNYNVGNVAGLGLDMLPLMQNQLHPGQYEQHVGFGPLQQPGPPPDMQQQRRFTEWHVRHWLASEESRENAELAQMQRMEVNNVLDRHADEWRQLRQRQARRRAQHSPQQQQVAGMNINVPAMPNLGPGAFDFQF